MAIKKSATKNNESCSETPYNYAVIKCQIQIQHVNDLISIFLSLGISLIKSPNSSTLYAER